MRVFIFSHVLCAYVLCVCVMYKSRVDMCMTSVQPARAIKDFTHRHTTLGHEIFAQTEQIHAFLDSTRYQIMCGLTLRKEKYDVENFIFLFSRDIHLFSMCRAEQQQALTPAAIQAQQPVLRA